MEEKKQIMVFGGCFNPPLNSHFSLAQQMLNDYCQIEKVLFVPVSNKYPKEGLASDEDRFNMLKLICDKNERFEVSRVEIDCDRQLFTIETLRKLQEEFPEYELTFLTGSDNLKELETWDKVDELVSEFKLYILKRDEDNIEKIISQSKFLTENRSAFIFANNKTISNLSSTFARECLKNNKSIRYLAPDEIISYIKENRLYEE